MSTDYFLFVNSNLFPDIDLPRLAENDGVELKENNQLSIDGLVCTQCEVMDLDHREIMLTDYGDLGQEYAWFLSGTYDKVTDINRLVERLVRCAATLVALRPLRPLALMRNAESFYVLNSPSELILSPICLDDDSILPQLFKKPYSIRHMSY